MKPKLSPTASNGLQSVVSTVGKFRLPAFTPTTGDAGLALQNKSTTIAYDETDRIVVIFAAVITD
jgi:hypothetical protein